MGGRGELTEAAWAVIAPLLPPNGGRGQPWRDHRTVLNGILWKLRTGAPLAGPARALRQVADGLRPLRPLAAGRHLGPAPHPRPDEVRCRRRGGLGREHRPHQHPGAPARGRGAATAEPGGREKGAPHAADEALGRSRGGLTTKLHLSCDGRGRPLSVVVTAGQVHESTQLAAVLDAIRVPRPGPGWPRKRPDRVLADKGYTYRRCR